MKKLLKYFITFIAIIFLFNLLLFVSSLFPSSWIENNVKKSSNRLTLEGNLYTLSTIFEVYNNNYTDAIMINNCYSIDNSDPFFSYMSARKNYKTGITTEVLPDRNGELISFSSNSNTSPNIDERRYTPVEELNEFLDEKVNTSIEYAKYWHGYLVFLRVSLIFFDIMTIRYFLVFIFMALLVILLILIKKKLSLFTAVIFGFALIIQGYFFVSYSLESTPIFITMMVSCIILLMRLDHIKNFYYYIFIVACVSNFVDFLTVPLITLCMPLYIFLLYNFKTKILSLKESFKIILFSCLTWTLGYSLTWLSKWILYDIAFNKNLISSAVSQMLYRTTSQNYLAHFTITEVLRNFILKNIFWICIFAISTIIILLFLNLFYTLFRKKEYMQILKTPFSSYIRQTIPFLFISILPFIWYIALSNHTVLHFYFVHRHMLIFSTGILLCFMTCFSVKFKKLD